MPHPTDTDWHSYVEAPLVVEAAELVEWSEEADVVVVGFGGAGAATSLQALDSGASVIAIDRFGGGGATQLSGGIVYAGGTRFQAEGGVEDTPDNMYAYLAAETGGAVDDATLRRFCRDSSANLEWLVVKGLEFNGAAALEKCYYPPDDRFLYHSGNELHPRFSAVATAAPRGHRTVGSGWTGYMFYNGLRDAAVAQGLTLLTHSPVIRLVTDASGHVLGVEIAELAPGTASRRRHARLIDRVNRGLNFFPDLARRIDRRLRGIEATSGKRRLIRARGGVVISAGSYSYNVGMRRRYAPRYENVMALGTLGCDGSGIRLGQSAGGAVGFMDSVTVWRSLQVGAYLKGLIVDGRGRRFVSEDSYSGSVGGLMGEEHAGAGWLILDAQLFGEARRKVLPGRGRHWLWDCLATGLNLLTAKKARTVAELATKCGIPASVLTAAVLDYNMICRVGADPFGKAGKLLHELTTGPFYAIDISLANRLYPCPSIPMGGLRVDEETGNVVDDGGRRIEGLFAAGRSAVGLPSKFYISGMSLADNVFSGRRAGRSCAAAAFTSRGRQRELHEAGIDE